MNILFSFSMFFLSFSPLWLAVLFVDLKSILFDISTCVYTEIITIILMFILTLFCSLIVWRGLKKKGLENTTRFQLLSAKEQKTIATEYLLSNILSMFSFDFTKWDQVVLFLIFFMIMAFLCIRHNHYSVNILLELCGYRTFNCKLRNIDNVECERIVIGKHMMGEKIGQSFHMRYLNNEYLQVISIVNDD